MSKSMQQLGDNPACICVDVTGTDDDKKFCMKPMCKKVWQASECAIMQTYNTVTYNLYAVLFMGWNFIKYEFEKFMRMLLT